MGGDFVVVFSVLYGEGGHWGALRRVRIGGTFGGRLPTDVRGSGHVLQCERGAFAGS